MTRRVRILFINCPTLDIAAASQLLLAQNTVQKTLEFELIHFWIYAYQAHRGRVYGPERLLEWYVDHLLPGSKILSRWLRARYDCRAAPSFSKPLAHETWRKDALGALNSHLTWVERRPEPVDRTQPTVIITETPLENNYISLTHGKIAVISAARWKEFFRPVSALDYILAATQRVTLRMSLSSSIRSHYPTRGCLWDYCQHQPDSRIAILSGHICSECLEALQRELTPAETVEVVQLVQNKWVGETAVLHSPASIMEKVYKYDLSRTSGLSSSVLKRILDAAVPEAGKLVVEALKWSLVVVLTLTIASYFPSLIKAYKRLSEPVPAGVTAK